jgi:hypothetical protein
MTFPTPTGMRVTHVLLSTQAPTPFPDRNPMRGPWHSTFDDQDHECSERLRIAKFTDKRPSLASLVSAPYGVHFDHERVLRSLYKV